MEQRFVSLQAETEKVFRKVFINTSWLYNQHWRRKIYREACAENMLEFISSRETAAFELGKQLAREEVK